MYVSPISAKRCIVCQTLLNVHQQAVGDTCDDPGCKHARLKEVLQQEHQRKVDLERKAMGCRDRVAKALGIEDPESLALAVLPSNNRLLDTLPERRKRRFRDRLVRVISQAASRLYGRLSQPAAKDADEPAPAGVTNAPRLALLGACCATCRGQCCEPGGEHAFICPETILRYMRDHPEARPRDVLEAYMSRVGNKTYRDSCVYQSRFGCLLPRRMRADICSRYLCAGLNEFLYRLDGSGVSAGFAVAVTEQQIVRAALIAEDGTTVETSPSENRIREQVRLV